MAITLTSLSPTSGLTGGRTQVKLTGTGFDTVGKVAVRFGGVPALRPEARTNTLVVCRTPIQFPGPVDVTVENVTLVEQATLVSAYTYLRPDLTGESSTLRAAFALVRELKRQVLARNVAVRTAPDYHLDGAPLQAQQAELPHIVLLGPRLFENRFDSTNELLLSQDLGAGTFERRYEPWVADVEFDVVLRSENLLRHMNTMEQLHRFFHQNPYLSVPQDLKVPTAGDRVYELKLLRALAITDPSSEDLAAGVVQSLGVCQVRGVLIEVQEVVESGKLRPPDTPVDLAVEVL